MSASAPRSPTAASRSCAATPRRPTRIVETDHGTLLALAHRRIDLADAVRSGGVAIVGDAKAVEHFLGLFTLPEPFASAA